MAISNLLPFKDAHLNLCETGYAAQGLPLERPRFDSDESIMAARMKVQLGAMEQLAKALGAGKLEAHFMPDGITTTRPIGRACFQRLNLLRVSKLFSTSRLPNNTPIPEQLSELKDGSLYLDRDEFERWLAQQKREAVQKPTAAGVGRCKEWLLETLKEAAQAGDRPRKAELRNYAVNELVVSERGFNGIWDEIMRSNSDLKAYFSRAGRKPKDKQSSRRFESEH